VAPLVEIDGMDDGQTLSSESSNLLSLPESHSLNLLEVRRFEIRFVLLIGPSQESWSDPPS
jgi:hypothetical protein